MVTLYFLSLPFKSENVSCKYKSKYNKNECTQTGDLVPDWLNLDNVGLLDYLGLGTNYSMKKIFKHNKKDYIVLNMSKKELIKKSLVIFLANTFLYIISTYITQICATAYFAMFSVPGCILSQPN